MIYKISWLLKHFKNASNAQKVIFFHTKKNVLIKNVIKHNTIFTNKKN